MKTLNTNWQTKAEYLEFVRDWKAAYALLSTTIRSTKRDSRIAKSLAAATPSKRFPDETQETVAQRAASRRADMQTLNECLGRPIWNLSGTATEMLQVRAAQKARAAQARADEIAARESAAAA